MDTPPSSSSSYLPGRMREARDLMEGDEVYLPLPDPDGPEWAMTNRFMWFMVTGLRGGFTITGPDGTERPGIEAAVYAPTNARTVTFFADHQVRTVRNRVSGPGSHMDVRVIQTDGVINTDAIYLPRGIRWHG